MKKIECKTASHPYSIMVGQNFLSRTLRSSTALLGRRVVIVTDENIAQLYLKDLLKELKHISVDCFFLKAGEENKTLSSWSSILDFLIEKHHDRNSVLIAFGGGSVGDVTGFAAASFMRGISWIQVPTSLLAQVDAAIGGKTGVNHLLGKNLIGAFHQPDLVLSDVSFLNSLNKREFASGFAEVIKYALISDVDFFEWLEVNQECLLLRNMDRLEEVVEMSSSIKSKLVSLDERDGGERRILNFGHTFGHALEAITGYTRYLHGEAVSIGMVMALSLSHAWCGLKKEILERAINLLNYFGLPTSVPELDEKIWKQYLLRDKKMKGDILNLVLLEKLGQPKIIACALFDSILNQGFDFYAERA